MRMWSPSSLLFCLFLMLQHTGFRWLQGRGWLGGADAEHHQGASAALEVGGQGIVYIYVYVYV